MSLGFVSEVHVGNDPNYNLISLSLSYRMDGTDFCLSLTDSINMFCESVFKSVL